MRGWHQVVAVIALLTAYATCNAADDFVLGAVNIAAEENGGRVVAASSEVREGRQVARAWRKENLIDGKHVEGPIVPADSYGWATETPPTPRNPHWVVFAFAQEKPRLVGAVRLDPRTNDAQIIGRWVRNFRIEFSLTTSQGPWESVDSFEVINEPVAQTFRFPTGILAKYLRLVITSNQGSDARLSLGEFEAYDALVGDDALTRIITGVEEQLQRLNRFAQARGAKLEGLPGEIPPYEDSLIAAAHGGAVVGVSSEATEAASPASGANPAVLEQWRATCLIDGLIATPDREPEHSSFGWSSNAAPSANRPEWVVFSLPGDTPAVIDSAVVDTRTRDPWANLRGARDIEVSTSIEGPDGPWKALGRWELPPEPAPRLLNFPPAEARWVRLSVLSNYGSDVYVQLGEFGVYRLVPDVDPLGGIAQELANVLRDLKLYHGNALREPAAAAGGQ